MLQCPQRCYSARPTQRPRGTAPRARMVGLSCRPRPRDASSCEQATNDDGAAVRWKCGGLRFWVYELKLLALVHHHLLDSLRSFITVEGLQCQMAVQSDAALDTSAALAAP